MKKVLFLFLIIILSACGNDNPSSAPMLYVISYKVEGGNRTASISYTNETGGTSYEKDVKLPWQKTLNSKYHSGAKFRLCASLTSPEEGVIKVIILRDGKTYKENTSPYGYLASACVEAKL